MVIFYQIRNCSAILKFCEFFAKYAAVSLPIVTPHWVYLGAIWVRFAAALAASCCRRRLARVAAALAASLSVGAVWPACCSPGCLVVCRCRWARIAAALAASLSVGAVWPALLQPWLLRCLSAPYGPRCCSPGCLVAELTRHTSSGPCEHWARACRSYELRRCLRRLAYLPLGAVVSQLLRFPVDLFDSVELSLQSLARLISFSADFDLACLCTQVLCGH